VHAVVDTLQARVPNQDAGNGGIATVAIAVALAATRQDSQLVVRLADIGRTVVRNLDPLDRHVDRLFFRRPNCLFVDSLDGVRDEVSLGGCSNQLVYQVVNGFVHVTLAFAAVGIRSSAVRVRAETILSYEVVLARVQAEHRHGSAQNVVFFYVVPFGCSADASEGGLIAVLDATHVSFVIEMLTKECDMSVINSGSRDGMLIL